MGHPVTFQKVDESRSLGDFHSFDGKAGRKLCLTCTCRFNLWNFRIDWRNTIRLCFLVPNPCVSCMCLCTQANKNQQTNLRNSKLNGCCNAHLFSLCDSRALCWARVGRTLTCASHFFSLVPRPHLCLACTVCASDFLSLASRWVGWVGGVFLSVGRTV